VTAKTAKIRNNYMPRFVFYPKIRFLFIENRFLHKIRKSASLARNALFGHNRHQIVI